MTGYGKSDLQSTDFHLDVSIKAVNGRYLEIKLHGPKIYHALEADIRKRVAKHMKRGTFDIYINRKAFSGREKINFNKSLAKNWLHGFNKLASELKLEKPTSSDILLQIPDLITVEESQKVSPQEKKKLFQVIDQATKACAEVRESEGKGLKKDIQGHISILAKNLAKIKKLRAQIQKELAQKYQQKIDKFNIPGEIDEQRLAQEVVIQIDRSDINEEIQRLEAHIKAIGVLILSKESIGKKLDFYAQELLREINTIGSKSGSSQLTQIVVDCKGAIEKYREQVQNVE